MKGRWPWLILRSKGQGVKLDIEIYWQLKILRTIYLENDEISGLKAELNQVMSEIEQDWVQFESQLHECRTRKSKLDEFARQEFLA